jgi:hypothetical protein
MNDRYSIAVQTFSEIAMNLYHDMRKNITVLGKK